jgi:hypothetical protein
MNGRVVVPDHDANRRLVETAAATHNARDREGFLACYGSEMRVLWGDRELVVTPDEHWNAVLAWAETFDGFAETIQQIMTEDDLVFLRSRYRGVHTGEWNGVPPTGKTVEWDAWQVLRIEDGLIIEERMLMDEWSLHQQLTSAD